MLNIGIRHFLLCQHIVNHCNPTIINSGFFKLCSRTIEERDHQPPERCIENGRKEFLGNSSIYNLPDSSAPGLDFSAAEEGIGNCWIEGFGRVFLQQTLHSPAFRKFAGIPKDDAVRIDTNLNGYLLLVILMSHGVQDALAKRIFREWRRLDPLEPLVRNHIVHVLGGQEVESTVNLLTRLPWISSWNAKSESERKNPILMKEPGNSFSGL